LEEKGTKASELRAKLLQVLKHHAPEVDDAKLEQVLSILRKVADDLKYLPPTTISTEKLRDIRQGLERELLVVTGRNEPPLLFKPLISELLQIVMESGFRAHGYKASASKPKTRPGDKRNKSTWEH
jgi:hypothetical protein